MHQTITRVDEIQAGDILLLRSNVGVSQEHPNGRRQKIKMTGFIPTQMYEGRPDPDFVMENPDSNERRVIFVPTNTGSIRVIAITSFWVMVDLPHWNGQGIVQWANVIFAKSYFQQAFLQQSLYYCQLAGNVHGNPLAPPAGEEDEADRNPPMAQANPYMIEK